MKYDDGRALSDTEVRRVLELAASRETSLSALTVGELRSAALEAGLNEDAVASALDDVLTGRAPIPSESADPELQQSAENRQRIRDINLGSAGSWLHVICGAGLGVAATAFQFSDAGTVGESVPLVAGALAAGSIALGLRKWRDAGHYLKAIAPTWISYLVTTIAALPAGAHPMDVVEVAAVATAVSAFAGSAVARWARKYRTEGVA